MSVASLLLPRPYLTPCMLPNPSHNPTPSRSEPPFMIRVEHLDVQLNGNFRPAAFVAFAAPLRQSGLLNALPPEGAKDLLTLLTFVTPNGGCAPTIHQLAEAMRVSEGKARGRLGRLLEIRWQGEPLLAHLRSESGLEVFAPRPWLAPAREDGATGGPPSPPPALRAAEREAVVAHSRAAYARPRAEVEREIEESMGYRRDEQGRLVRLPAPVRTDDKPTPLQPIPLSDPPLSPKELEAARERDEVKRLLLQAGLLPEQAESMVGHYDMVRIRRQLMWLPLRKAKNPAGMLLAAIKDDYEAPPSLWRSTPDGID